MQIIRPSDIPENDLAATDAILTASNVAADDASEWSSATSYTTGDKVVVLGTTQRLYEALQDNTDSFPPDNSTDWIDLGAINRWKMFDGGTNTQTVNSDSIVVTVEPDRIINAFSIFNIEAAEINVVMTDAQEGVVFDETYNLVDNGGIDSWYNYFFEDIVFIDQLADLTLPAYGSPSIDITITNTGADAKCGLLVIGTEADIGTTIFGTSVGIRDFSRKEADAFGNFNVVERRFFRLVDYDARVPTDKVQYVQRLLSSRRALPTVYIGNVDNPETIVYGYYRDFDIVLSNPAFSNATIEVEGL